MIDRRGYYSRRMSLTDTSTWDTKDESLVDFQFDAGTYMKTLRLKIRQDAYAWLNAAAIEVNEVWNGINEIAFNALRSCVKLRKWLGAAELCGLSAGTCELTPHIGADTIQRLCFRYAHCRQQQKKARLAWRKSYGCRRNRGWVPLKAASLKRKGRHLRFCGKTFRVFEAERLEGVKWGCGQFSQDAVGDWYLTLPVKVPRETTIAPQEAVGIDLGLKTIAVTSDGDRLEAAGFYRGIEPEIAQAQRRGHRRQAKRLHRKARRRREDAHHQFSRKIVNEYQYIVVGDVSSAPLVKTGMAKSVLDSGWSTLKRYLLEKGACAGRTVKIVDERNTTRECSSCGCRSGPSGLRGLVVRAWECAACGEAHDRDVNAARNILRVGLRCQPPSPGTSNRAQGPRRGSASRACPTGIGP